MHVDIALAKSAQFEAVAQRIALCISLPPAWVVLSGAGKVALGSVSLMEK
jgi:hypothetical protein